MESKQGVLFGRVEFLVALARWVKTLLVKNTNKGGGQWRLV